MIKWLCLCAHARQHLIRRRRLRTLAIHICPRLVQLMVHLEHLLRIAFLLREFGLNSLLLKLKLLKIKFELRNLLLCFGKFHHGFHVEHHGHLRRLLHRLKIKLYHCFVFGNYGLRNHIVNYFWPFFCHASQFHHDSNSLRPV